MIGRVYGHSLPERERAGADAIGAAFQLGSVPELETEDETNSLG